MSGAGLGYSIVDARATFATYSNATKILAAKSDTGTAVTESGTATKAGSIWADQIDDFIDEVNQILTGNLDIPGPVIINGNLTLDAANAVHTIGDADAAGSPSTHAEVSATGTYQVQVDNQTNNWQGGWGYNNSNDSFTVRVANADNTYFVGTAVYPATDSALQLGLSISRWSDFFTDAATIGGNLTQDVGGNITNTMEVGATGVAAWYVHDGTNAADGGWWYDTSGNRLVLRAANVDQLTLNASQFKPGLDNALSAGETAKRFSSVWGHAATFTNTLTLDATSPTFTMGDGVTTGQPEVRILRGPSGNGLVSFFDSDTTASVDDVRIVHGSDDRWRIDYHDGTDFREWLSVTDDATYAIGAGAQSAATLTLFGSSGGRVEFVSGGPVITSGSGTPESAVTADIGSIYMRTDGGASTSIYVKESGTGNTGWVAK